jgi:XTP/dITP diphosphohydrolase
MLKLVFASSNKNKIKEIRELTPPSINLLGLSDINCHADIPETGATIEENAILKAEYVVRNFDLNCFADDSGLEVEALNGAPGVYSARYAGKPKDDLKNIQKLLEQLRGKENRNARFKTVIALILDGKQHCFEGIIKGQITREMMGNNGFGYDPVFIPEGYSQTFAQMDGHTKNSISHRGIALHKLLQFLKKEKGGLL